MREFGRRIPQLLLVLLSHTTLSPSRCVLAQTNMEGANASHNLYSYDRLLMASKATLSSRSRYTSSGVNRHFEECLNGRRAQEPPRDSPVISTRI